MRKDRVDNDRRRARKTFYDARSARDNLRFFVENPRILNYL